MFLWLHTFFVAPRAGAWIETLVTGLACCFILSLPVRERGLKPFENRHSVLHEQVAPRAGAWIETFARCPKNILRTVAPRAGAWIETGGCWLLVTALLSLPVRERGLKLALSVRRGHIRRSLPVRERGLKLVAKGSDAIHSGVAPRAGAWIETCFE